MQTKKKARTPLPSNLPEIEINPKGKTFLHQLAKRIIKNKFQKLQDRDFALFLSKFTDPIEYRKFGHRGFDDLASASESFENIEIGTTERTKSIGISNLFAIAARSSGKRKTEHYGNIFETLKNRMKGNYRKDQTRKTRSNSLLKSIE